MNVHGFARKCPPVGLTFLLLSSCDQAVPQCVSNSSFLAFAVSTAVISQIPGKRAVPLAACAVQRGTALLPSLLGSELHVANAPRYF